MQMPIMAKGVFMAALYGLMDIFRQGRKTIDAEMPECEPIGSPFVGYQDFVKHSGAVFACLRRIQSNLPRIRLNPGRSASLPVSKQEEENAQFKQNPTKARRAEAG
jgi:hypothetical protein